MKNKYDVGATWIAENKNGKVVIWLDAIYPTFESWRWSFYYSDGSYPGGFESGDWGTSYRMCYDMCAWKLSNEYGKIPRFKRVRLKVR